MGMVLTSTLAARVVEWMVKDATENTESGTWVTYFDEVCEATGVDLASSPHILDRVIDLLRAREEVAEVLVNPDSLDVVYYTGYCWQINDKDAYLTARSNSA